MSTNEWVLVFVVLCAGQANGQTTEAAETTEATTSLSEKVQTAMVFVFAIKVAIVGTLTYIVSRIRDIRNENNARSIDDFNNLHDLMGSRSRQLVIPAKFKRIFDSIAHLDTDECVSKAICTMSATSAKKLTSSQRTIVTFFRSMTTFIPTSPDAPRMKFMEAAIQGEDKDSYDPCARVGEYCPTDSDSLLSATK